MLRKPPIYPYEGQPRGPLGGRCCWDGRMRGQVNRHAPIWHNVIEMHPEPAALVDRGVLRWPGVIVVRPTAAKDHPP
jgi:hypothetical protein